MAGVFLNKRGDGEESRRMAEREYWVASFRFAGGAKRLELFLSVSVSLAPRQMAEIPSGILIPLRTFGMIPLPYIPLP